MTKPTAVQPVDLGIIVALKEEVRELLQLAGKNVPHSEGGMNSYLFERGAHRCAVTLVGKMGEAEAARVTERHIAQFDPVSVVSIGISGGVHEDLRVGDVYVPGQTVQYIQDAKTSPGEAGGYVFVPGPPAREVDHQLHTAATGFDLNHEAAHIRWRADGHADLESLVTDAAIRERLFAQDLVRREADVRADGHEACGPVVSGASAFSDWIRSHDRNVKAIDMESAAVVIAAQARNDPRRALVIRGISDYGDPRKKELDAIGKGGLRKYAMRNAVRFLFALLDAGELPLRPR